MELDHTITLAIEQFLATAKSRKERVTSSFPINSRDADADKVKAAVADASKALGQTIDHKLETNRLILSTAWRPLA